ncbi:MAG: hypothetical protein JXR96_20120 [Deltaproteobacteria bacterium]|nr:hypothetical protein [Deltaproteobacteria bacterium]
MGSFSKLGICALVVAACFSGCVDGESLCDKARELTRSTVEEVCQIYPDCCDCICFAQDKEADPAAAECSCKEPDPCVENVRREAEFCLDNESICHTIATAKIVTACDTQ